MATSGKSILFIGNSITLHGKCSYWWGEWGMAASSRASDYVHKVVRKLKNGGVEPKFACLNFAVWETMHYDRAETLQLLDKFLGEEWTWVVVQLGENVHELTSLESDFEELIDYVSSRLPSSRIIILDNVWNLPESHRMKQNVAGNNGVDFIDLSDLWDDKSLLCGLGTEVESDDGERHIVEHNGVAAHPGDAYMAEIAGRLLRCMEQGMEARLTS